MARMKNSVLLFLAFLALSGCRSEEAILEEIAAIEPEIERIEEVVEEEKKEPKVREPIEEDEVFCENDWTWEPDAKEVFLAPYEELYARKVYKLTNWGIEFEIPGPSSNYNAFLSKETGKDILWLAPISDAGCLPRGDFFYPSIERANKTDELLYSQREDDFFVQLEDTPFPSFSAQTYREDYLGNGELIGFEFELEGQLYAIKFIRNETASGTESLAQADEDMIMGLLETFKAIE